MITTAGENVVDMIYKGKGMFHAVPGGSPLNIAAALGRLETKCGYAMPISADSLGGDIVAALEKEGVSYLPKVRPDRPTGLALVSVKKDGQPSYTFYREGAADIDLQPGELPELPAETTHLHVGGSPSLGHDHCGEMLTEWALGIDESLSMSVDPNIRPTLVADKDRFMARIDRLIERCDLFRLSDEDSQYMYGEASPEQVVSMLLERGCALAVVTMGVKGVILANEKNKVTSEAVSAGETSDTVGAGDCFLGAMLSWMQEHDCLKGSKARELSEDDLFELGRFAAAGAAINCSRDGCDPPTHSEIQELLRHKELFA